MSNLGACVFRLQKTIAGLVGAVGRGDLRPRGSLEGGRAPPPSKRARLSSPSRHDWSAPSAALPTLAARVAGSPAPHPSILPKKASKSGLELLVGGSAVPSLLSWSDLPHLWSVRAAGNSFSSIVKEEARSDARPCSLDWAPGTPEYAAGFLSGPSASVGPLPSSF